MDLASIKEYLRVDNSNQDNYIDVLIKISDDYMENAIDNYREKMKDDKFKMKSEICQKAIIQDMFDNRTLINKDSEMTYIIRSMITQLQT
ncbi:hypothetical protein HMPREF9630_00218 [Peptoanaerobacter stomatis]|uniref:Phage gp6-like head-tail connector protein n=1 Tax=Peptoanaerobacter stomatis TaxID=796937 RepID=V9HVS3_9FIRM|nr:head-tail connector protein [Peptoanaerobacter stomatis]EHL18493.1 hypothetical protein HMPREF9630_00218 [Peptoanaerobacter stomatis]